MEALKLAKKSMKEDFFNQSYPSSSRSMMKLRKPSRYAKWRARWKQLQVKPLLLDISRRSGTDTNSPNRALMLQGFQERFPEVTHAALQRERAFQRGIHKLFDQLT